MSYRSPEQYYDVGPEIGRGSFSVVHLVTDRKTGEQWAMKSLQKRYMTMQGWTNLKREIEIMLNVDHPNILRMKELFETPTEVHLIVEYMKGGELFDQIIQRGAYGEQDAIKIVKQILNGISYLHSVGVCHRDLKPENLLCSEDGRIVVADFGLAKIFGRGELLMTHCGTPNYAAPEIIRGDRIYDKAIDMWSIGVITYVLLCGFFPFYDEDDAQLKKKIKLGEFSFPSVPWDEISSEAKRFISTLLCVDPTQRYTAEQALKDPWISNTQLTNKINLRSSMEIFQNKRKEQRQNILNNSANE